MKNYGADSETVGQPRRRAFTLIELLVVLTIIGLLAGLIMPAVSSALGSGKGAGCTSNVRQIALALVAFDGDMGYMPWLNNGPWTPQKDSTGAPTNSTRNSTNWCDALIKYNYISVTAKDKGVWRCPGASSSEIYGKDTSGNPANFGGYGVEWHVFRDENSQDSKTFDNIPNPKLKMARVTRPSTLWLVGDCGRPVTQSAKVAVATSARLLLTGIPALWDSGILRNPTPILLPRCATMARRVTPPSIRMWCRFP